MRFLLPKNRCALTTPFHPYHKVARTSGGIFSAALSLGLPPPGVTRHRVSMEPGLSSPRPEPKSGHPVSLVLLSSSTVQKRRKRGRVVGKALGRVEYS